MYTYPGGAKAFIAAPRVPFFEPIAERAALIGIPLDVARERFEAAPRQDAASLFRALLEADALAAGKPRWGEKTPDHAGQLFDIFRWFPDARVVWMVRDPRAVVASRMRRTWNRASLATAAGIAGRRLERAATLAGKEPRVLVVRYETFVERPEHGLRRVCAFLGEDYDPAMLAAGAAVARYNSTFIDTSSDQAAPISTDAVDGWRTALSRQEVALVDWLARDGMRAWGYRPASNPVDRVVAALRFGGPAKRPIPLRRRPRRWLRRTLRRIRRR
jgi:hypothetical protein